jgi:preprotein translocase subunit SecF
MKDDFIIIILIIAILILVVRKSNYGVDSKGGNPSLSWLSDEQYA